MPPLRDTAMPSSPKKLAAGPRVAWWHVKKNMKVAEEEYTGAFYVGKDVGAAYRAAGDAQPLGGLDRISLPYARFRLTGQTLPQTRTLVARHTDRASGVVSYEVLRILFPPPRG